MNEEFENQIDIITNSKIQKFYNLHDMCLAFWYYKKTSFMNP